MVDPVRGHYGDPHQILSLARDLNELADQMLDRAESVVKRADAIGFKGPKAERFRDRVARGREQAGLIAGDMSLLANSLQLVAAAARANIEAYEAAVNHNPYEDL